MSDNTISKQKANSQELANLTDEYRKKRREIVDKNETSLKALREEYNSRLQKEKATSAAAVNHIKNSASNQVEVTREQADQRVIQEKRAAEQKIQTAKTQIA